MTTPGGVRAIAGKSTGRFYFEAVHQYGTSAGSAIGVADASASEILGLGADTHGYGVYPSGAVYHSGISVGSVTPFGLGDTVGVAVDVTSKLMWARVNAGVWNADPTADPAAGTGGISIAGISTVYPMCTVQAASPVPASALGVHFDGATYLSTASLTATDNAFLSFSLWFHDNNPAPNYWTHWVVDPAGLYISNDEIFTTAAYGIVVADAAFANVLRDSSAVSAVTYGTWHNVLCSVNVNFAAGLKIHNLYLDGVEITNAVQDTNAAFVMAWNGRPFFVNSDTNFSTIGDLAEFWFAPGQFIDFTVAANRQKFLSAGGQPVDLGADGSTPTGTAPAIYLSRRTGDLPAVFATNRGTGGAFTTTGALTAAATNPSL